MNEKCFCHLNGYKVKDADARKLIEGIRRFKNKKFLLIGDSLADENRGESAPCWVTYFRNMLNDSCSTLNNVSSSGVTLSNVRQDNNLQTHIEGITETYDYIILSLGTNDWNLNATMEQMINALTYFETWKNEHSPNAFVYLITPTKSLLTTNREIPLDYYRGILTRYAIHYGWYIIDSFAEAPNYNGNVTELKDLFSIDGVHYSPTYAPIYAEYIFHRISCNTSSMVNNYTTRITLPNYYGDTTLYLLYNSNGAINLVLGLNSITPTDKKITISLPSWAKPYLNKTFATSATLNGAVVSVFARINNGTLELFFPEANVTYASLVLNIEYPSYVTNIGIIG